MLCASQHMRRVKKRQDKRKKQKISREKMIILCLFAREDDWISISESFHANKRQNRPKSLKVQVVNSALASQWNNVNVMHKTLVAFVVRYKRIYNFSEWRKSGDLVIYLLHLTTNTIADLVIVMAGQVNRRMVRGQVDRQMMDSGCAWLSGYIDGLVDRWIEGWWVGGQMDGRTYGWWLHRWIDKWVDRWIGGSWLGMQMDGWMVVVDGQMVIQMFLNKR